MLDFGVTVLPDPPQSRFFELVDLTEQHGFDYAWTYDSHILWQESYATLPGGRVAYAEGQARPLRDQPGHP